MKKLSLFLLTLTFSANLVFAQSQYASVLSKIETSLFGIEYAKQTDLKRLERIENSVYGKTSSGDFNSRISRLKDDVVADLMGKEIKPVEDTFMDREEVAENVPKEDKSVNYLAVDIMEKQVFNRDYKALDIKTRLSNLEKQSFSQTFENEDLNSRVERLKSSLMPKNQENIASAEEKILSKEAFNPNEQDYSDYFIDEDYNRIPYNGLKNYQPQTPNIIMPQNRTSVPLAQLSVLERTILKKNYNGDTDYDRLSRLENKLFKTQFDEDDAQTRMNRIASAYQANKSSAIYDDNKMSQRVTTALQIGTLILMVLACIL